MRMLQAAVDEIVSVVPMRHRLVPAAGAMYVALVLLRTPALGCALVRISRRDLDPMLIDMVAVHMV